MFQAKTADKFLGNLKLLARTTDRMEGTKKVMSSVMQGLNTALSAVGLESSKLQSLGGAPNVDPLGEIYYSVMPFRDGDYVAKFSIAPMAPDLLALKDSKIDVSGRPDAIRETVQSEMRGIDGRWELRVQLCRDLEKQPVEDPTVQWDEEEAPFQTVATITVPRQDSWEPARVRAVDEQMRFSIWTGLAAHRPLGNINHARRDTTSIRRGSASASTAARCTNRAPARAADRCDTGFPAAREAPTLPKRQGKVSGA